MQITAAPAQRSRPSIEWPTKPVRRPPSHRHSFRGVTAVQLANTDTRLELEAHQHVHRQRSKPLENKLEHLERKPVHSQSLQLHRAPDRTADPARDTAGVGAGAPWRISPKDGTA